MQQGISTRYFGPSNVKGSRIKATARKAISYNDGTRNPELSLTDNWNHATGADANHTRVAKLLAAKLGWAGVWVGGGSPENSGYHYVNLGNNAPIGLDAIGQQDIDWFIIPAAL